MFFFFPCGCMLYPRCMYPTNNNSNIIHTIVLINFNNFHHQPKQRTTTTTTTTTKLKLDMILIKNKNKYKNSMVDGHS